MAKKINIAIIGAGTMGQGIAQLALQAGHKVWLIDQAQEQLTKAKAGLDKLFSRFVEKNKIDSQTQKQWLENLQLHNSMKEIAQTQLVIEAIVERLDVKQHVFVEIENLVSEQTILASNTSSLSITAIASVLQNPQRFLGLHFFNPPGIMPLVEVVKAVQTEDAVVEQAMQLMKSWGKTAVLCKDTPGFIVNRVARPFYIESFRLLEEQAVSQMDLDASLREGMGFRMGPCELTDFIGQDVNYAVSSSLWTSLGYPLHLQPSYVQENLVLAKYLGKKSQRGFYRYDQKNEENKKEENQKPNKETVAWINTNEEKNQEYGNSSYGKFLGILENGVLLYQSNGTRAIDIETQLQKPVAVVDIHNSPSPLSLAIAYGVKAASLMHNKVPAGNQMTQRWIVMPDRPALINLRVISMIINEAATMVLQDIAHEQGVDNALKGGVNYPQGAFEWLEFLGIETVYNALVALSNYYSGYRISPYIKDQFEQHKEVNNR